MKLIAIIVTYEPDLITLEKLLTVLSPQVDEIVLIDNQSNVDIQSLLTKSNSETVNFVKLTENFGIAYAQNIGIEMARDLNASHVLLMDQDSIPSLNMVNVLKSALAQADSKSIIKKPIAAVGPSYVDMRSGEKSFFVIEKEGLPNRLILADEELNLPSVDVTFLISSGMLIDLSAIEKIGGKRSSYFIDHVDTEWSFRAILNGYRLLGVPSAEMYHSLGDTVRNVWFFGKRQISYHSPLRNYYMCRNTLLMLRDTKIKLIWQLHFLWRIFQFACYFLIFATERRQRFYCMALGFWHGLVGVSGKVNLRTAKCTSIPLTKLDI